MTDHSLASHYVVIYEDEATGREEFGVIADASTCRQYVLRARALGVRSWMRPYADFCRDVLDGQGHTPE